MVDKVEVVENRSIWLLDNGTSNHMTGKKELFHQLDKSVRHKVRLSDDKEVDVLGKGSVVIQVNGGMKLIHEVQFVPSLAYNLLSARQLIEIRYNVNFSKSWCKIENTETGVVLMNVQKSNNLFPVEFSKSEHTNLIVKDEDMVVLWHKRYGHLNF